MKNAVLHLGTSLLSNSHVEMLHKLLILLEHMASLYQEQ